MGVFYENLAHFTHGMALMAFLMAACLLYSRRGESRLMMFLFWEMVFWTFVQVKDLDYLYPGIWETDYLPNIQQSIDMWCIPATILLFIEIVSPRWTTWRRAALLALPSVLFTLAYALFPSDAVFTAGLGYTVVMGLTATTMVFRASSRHDNFILRNFSYVEHITLDWMRRVIGILFLLLVVWSAKIAWPTWLSDALYYPFSIGIWAIVYYYTTQHMVVETPDDVNFFREEEALPTVLPALGADAEAVYPFEARLQALMERERIYLNPKLTIADVATEAGTNRTYLSEYLNRRVGVSFYEYINAYRVREACRMLDDDAVATAETVAENCGFYSFSTFRRSFLRETGLSPAQYRKRKG